MPGGKIPPRDKGEAESLDAAINEKIVPRLGNRGAGILDGRNGQVWRRYSIYRHSQEQIAQDLGISNQRVSQIIADIRKKTPREDVEEMRSRSRALHEEVMQRALEIADRAGAPIAVGKDGKILRDPETNEVVRDYSGQVKALDLAMKADESNRKLLGLDAAQKTQSSATVRYEVAGVDMEDLS